MDYFSTHWGFRQRAVHSCRIGQTLQLGKFPQLSSQTHIRRLKDLQPDLWRCHLTTSCIKCVQIMQLTTSSTKLSSWTDWLLFVKYKTPFGWNKLKQWREEGFPLLLRPATRGAVEHLVVQSAFHAKSVLVHRMFLSIHCQKQLQELKHHFPKVSERPLFLQYLCREVGGCSRYRQANICSHWPPASRTWWTSSLIWFCCE